ncbi:MAG: hypothetical protein U9O78_02525 [Patescibacteria group bacterium]|nr:hypothetical protein [Patescibacteria group bacterium]
MTDRKILVTHHSPDLDAIGAVWILKKFDSQHYADAKIAFVNPGERITEQKLQNFGIDIDQATHVDTGKGKFDHHQPERASKMICAVSLTYEYVNELHPELKKDQALKKLVDFVNEIDHFQEIHWPQADSTRYVMMIHQLIQGHELTQPHNDDSQMHFGLKCLDYAYNVMKHTLQAQTIIKEDGINFTLGQKPCLGLETCNGITIKEAQKMGYALVVRKDDKQGNIRIKVRPDSDLNLKSLYNQIKKIDQTGTWFFHPGGKMLLNGSKSHHNQIPSPLSLKEIMALIKKTYGKK